MYSIVWGLILFVLLEVIKQFFFRQVLSVPSPLHCQLTKETHRHGCDLFSISAQIDLYIQGYCSINDFHQAQAYQGYHRRQVIQAWEHYDWNDMHLRPYLSISGFDSIEYNPAKHYPDLHDPGGNTRRVFL